jgi:hypothetical protein
MYATCDKVTTGLAGLYLHYIFLFFIYMYILLLIDLIPYSFSGLNYNYLLEILMNCFTPFFYDHHKIRMPHWSHQVLWGWEWLEVRIGHGNLWLAPTCGQLQVHYQFLTCMRQHLYRDRGLGWRDDLAQGGDRGGPPSPKSRGAQGLFSAPQWFLAFIVTVLEKPSQSTDVWRTSLAVVGERPRLHAWHIWASMTTTGENSLPLPSTSLVFPPTCQTFSHSPLTAQTTPPPPHISSLFDSYSITAHNGWQALKAS